MKANELAVLIVKEDDQVTNLRSKVISGNKYLIPYQ